MKTRSYSAKKEAAWIFADLLNHIARRGWFSAAPSVEDGMSLLYAAFHVHPDDADRVFSLIQSAISVYGGRTQWVLNRQQHNRFLIYPEEVAMEAKPSGDIGLAAMQLSKIRPDLEREAARDMILLCDKLYEVYFEERFGK